ncbi:MAG: PAS domain-containing protein [Desulfatiglandaceae bacterium]
MTDEKNNPSLQSNLSPFPGLSQLRQQAEQKARSMPLPDLDAMSHEEIRHMMYEMQVKQIEADLLVEQWHRQREERDDQAELFRIVTENMLDMAALTDMEGNFTFAGKAHEILGYEPSFLIGKNVMNFVHPEDLPRILEAFR